MNDFLQLLGRVLFGGYFLMNAYNHFTHLAPMAAYAQAKKVPSPKAAVLGSGILLLVGGLSVLLNVSTTIGLWALVVFLVPVTFSMHQFWNVQDPAAKMPEQINFMKNMALVGGILMLLFR